MKELATLVFNGIQIMTSGKSSTDFESSGAYSSLMSSMTIVAKVLANKECVKRIVQDSTTGKIIVSVFEGTFITADTHDDKQQIHAQAILAWERLLETIRDDADLQEAIAIRLCQHVRSALMDTSNMSR
jgi:hypothetical protein